MVLELVNTSPTFQTRYLYVKLSIVAVLMNEEAIRGVALSTARRWLDVWTADASLQIAE